MTTTTELVIERTPVTSSNLKSAGYDAESMTLEIEFHSGAVYRYANVPQEHFIGLITTTSPGAYFNANIRDQYPSTKVGDSTAAHEAQAVYVLEADTAVRLDHRLFDLQNIESEIARLNQIRERLRANILDLILSAGGETYRNDLATVSCAERKDVKIADEPALIKELAALGEDRYVEFVDQKLIKAYFKLSKTFYEHAKAGFFTREGITVEVSRSPNVRWVKREDAE
ncbi:MAG: hypothetical protein JWP44_4502 [Mucilaginibacter sp.]|nr:hypothetical protein [Mucilaginibacter sp.]